MSVVGEETGNVGGQYALRVNGLGECDVIATRPSEMIMMQQILDTNDVK